MAEILVIEDEPEVRELIRLSLERDNHVVREAADANEARAALGGAEVVILDLVLPEFDGMEILREIRAGDPEVPVLVLTALVTVKDKVEALDSGAFDYVTKPFEPEELLARVRAALRVREAQSLNRRMTEQLETIAAIDPATRLPNRRALEMRLAEECHRLQRGLGPSSVLVADIDDLAGINEELGDGAGDRVVAEVARVLRSALRRSDVVFRYGGEEFVVLLAGSGHEGATVAAERIAGAVRRSAMAGERPVTISVGVAEGLGNDTPESLIARARGSIAPSS